MMISTKKIAIKLLLAMLSMSPALSFSAFITPPFTHNNESIGYIGLQWFTEETPVVHPNIVVGFRQTKTDASDNKINGYDLMLTYSIEKKQFDALRASYLDGACNFLGAAGLGYSFKKSAVLGFIDAIGPYARVIAEVDGNAHPGAGLDLSSLGCPGDRKIMVLD